MLNDFDAVNTILAELAEQNIVENIAEPCDCADAHPLDWAEVAGVADEIFNEMYPDAEMMLDNYDNPWYVY